MQRLYLMALMTLLSLTTISAQKIVVGPVTLKDGGTNTAK